MAEVLRAAITGTEDPTVFPTHVIDGIPASVDAALADGIAGRLDARSLATTLGSVSYETPDVPDEPKPWRTLALFAAIVVLISLIGAVGLAADFDPDSPFLYPVGAEPIDPPVRAPDAPEEPEDASSLATTALVYDPFGDGTESDEAVALVLDGNRATVWVTETYSRPIRDFKDGVGIVFEVDGTPSAMLVTGTPGTRYVTGWAPSLPDDATEWEHIARGTLQAAETRVQLPGRLGGLWRLWLVGLPERSDGTFQSRISEVGFVR